MTHGEWVLAAFVLGSVLVCVGAFVTQWWVFVPGILILASSFVMTAFEPRERDRRWP